MGEGSGRADGFRKSLSLGGAKEKPRRRLVCPSGGGCGGLSIGGSQQIHVGTSCRMSFRKDFRKAVGPRQNREATDSWKTVELRQTEATDS